MTDIQNYGVAHTAAQLVTVPGALISATVIDDSGAIIADYTNGAEINFPAALAALSLAQRTRLMDSIALDIVRMRAGLD